jgi:hypothetical protein
LKSAETQTFVSATMRSTVPVANVVACLGDVRFDLVTIDRGIEPRLDSIEQGLELGTPGSIAHELIPSKLVRGLPDNRRPAPSLRRGKHLQRTELVAFQIDTRSLRRHQALSLSSDIMT